MTRNNEALWNIFVEKYEPDFKQYLGYGKEEIEQIGIDLFFETMGWDKEEQMTSYKTDRMHIMPCIECKQHFAVYEEDYGLCEHCAPLFDLDEFTQYVDRARVEGGARDSSDILSAFYASKDFRNSFRKKDADEIDFFIIYYNDTKTVCSTENALTYLHGKDLPDDAITFQCVCHNGKMLEHNGTNIFHTLDELPLEK